MALGASTVQMDKEDLNFFGELIGSVAFCLELPRSPRHLSWVAGTTSAPSSRPLTSSCSGLASSTNSARLGNTAHP